MPEAQPGAASYQTPPPRPDRTAAPAQRPPARLALATLLRPQQDGRRHVVRRTAGLFRAASRDAPDSSARLGESPRARPGRRSAGLVRQSSAEAGRSPIAGAKAASTAAKKPGEKRLSPPAAFEKGAKPAAVIARCRLERVSHDQPVNDGRQGEKIAARALTGGIAAFRRGESGRGGRLFIAVLPRVQGRPRMRKSSRTGVPSRRSRMFRGEISPCRKPA